MIAKGMKVVELSGEGRRKYLEADSRASWDRLTKRDPTNVAALKQKFMD
jgi:hypothetical protein